MRSFLGSTCVIGNQDNNLCGVDADGFLYYASEEQQTLSCTDDGSWKNSDSPDPITEPVCIAKPCPQMMVASSSARECKIGDTVVDKIKGK